MNNRPRRNLNEAYNDYLANNAFFEQLYSLGFIRGIELFLLDKAVLDLDAERMDELTMRVRDDAQTLIRGIDLGVLYKAINGDSESVTKVSQLLLDEIKKGRDLAASGEAHAVSRGLVMAPSNINALAIEMLKACRRRCCPPPEKLVELITVQLEVDARARRQIPRSMEKFEALLFLAENPEIGVRRLAKKLGVSHTTVSEWLRDRDFQSELERFQSANSVQSASKDDHQ